MDAETRPTLAFHIARTISSHIPEQTSKLHGDTVAMNIFLGKKMTILCNTYGQMHACDLAMTRAPWNIRNAPEKSWKLFAHVFTQARDLKQVPNTQSKNTVADYKSFPCLKQAYASMCRRSALEPSHFEAAAGRPTQEPRL